MERKEAQDILLNILLNKNNPYADVNEEILKRYPYGEMTPISPLTFESSNTYIIITEDVKNDLEKIRQKTLRNDRESAFLLVGEIKGNGTIYFDTFFTDNQQSEQTSADYAPLMESLTEYVNYVKRNELKNKPVICFGHTHGRTSVSDNYSLGDLISTVRRTEADASFKSKIATMSLLLPPSGDYNFIMFDNKNNYGCLYRFDYITVVMSEKTKLEKGIYAEDLPAYQNGNYLIDRTSIRR